MRPGSLHPVAHHPIEFRVEAEAVLRDAFCREKLLRKRTAIRNTVVVSEGCLAAADRVLQSPAHLRQ